jgi:hypothetical protein
MLTFLIANINITTAGTFNWNIKISDSDLAKTAKWVLEFKPHTSPPVFNNSAAQISSPGFIITVADTASSSSSSVPSPTSSSSTSSSPAPVPATTSSGLSTGAKVAIGVIIPVVVLAALALGLFFFMKKRRAKNNITPPGYEQGQGHDAGAASGYYDPSEIKAQPYTDLLPPPTLPTELEETEVRTPVEMPTTRY